VVISRTLLMKLRKMSGKGRSKLYCEFIHSQIHDIAVFTVTLHSNLLKALHADN